MGIVVFVHIVQFIVSALCSAYVCRTLNSSFNVRVSPREQVLSTFTCDYFNLNLPFSLFSRFGKLRLLRWSSIIATRSKFKASRARLPPLKWPAPKQELAAPLKRWLKSWKGISRTRNRKSSRLSNRPQPSIARPLLWLNKSSHFFSGICFILYKSSFFKSRCATAK